MQGAASRLQLRRRLLTWFRKNARQLPWRLNRDPYRIWISEVMLQQTQVATVIPYFARFLQQYPTLTQLARAEEQEVLRLWEGLGYYRRARDLLRAAKLLDAASHATIPDDIDFVRTLPGFGRYTANAVLSQAFDRRLPILEANSQRVLCRLFAIDESPKHSAVQKMLWQLAESLLPSKKTGDFNQALMELGALVCTPMRPACDTCPLQRDCLAHRAGRQHDIPRRPDAVEITLIEEVAIIVRKRDRVLLVQRPDTGRWAGMWEMPHAPTDANSPDVAALCLLDSLGLTGDIVGPLTTIRHSVTRFRITMTCLQAQHRSGRPNAASFAWVRPHELSTYPLATPQRRLAQVLATSMNLVEQAAGS
ncbi:MAG TPA: A/G-specific adenine glycosylase [Gemmataceae bacterium]|nr:A/G-specific adenine glycosylase [Gemmataceae bacterium]